MYGAMFNLLHKTLCFKSFESFKTQYICICWKRSDNIGKLPTLVDESSTGANDLSRLCCLDLFGNEHQ